MRLPYGLSSASEVFQRNAQEMLENMDGVAVFVDNILIWGNNKKEHDERLNQVLLKAREVNLKLNKRKCKLRLKELTYLGHIISEEGLKPDDTKVQAIMQMAVPQNRKDLERFMGTVNYEAKFIPNLSEVAAPLRELLKTGIEWHWMEHQQSAFERLKALMCEAPVLEYFDLKKPVLIQCDASKDGVGAVLKHERPVAYASKSLTDSQKNYAQIEKELYAIVFACEHFHQYVYGRKIKVHTDHKRLVSIIKKPLAVAPMRLQRLMLRLQKYDIDLEYIAGKDLHTADMLSRASLQEKNEDDEIDETLTRHVNMLMNNMPVSDEKIEELQDATRNDEHLQTIIELM